MNYQVIPNKLPFSEIEEKIEQLRYKGRGAFRKKPLEEISYIKLLLWPCQYFEISYTIKREKRSSNNFSAVRNFMLGNFSLPFLINILQNDGGRKALSLIFSRENQTIFESLTRLRTSLPALTFFDPSDIYHQLYKTYSDQRASLENQLDQIIQEMRPIYAEAVEYHRKAEDLHNKIRKFSGDKKSSEFRELRSTYSEYMKNSKNLRRKADKTISTQERKVKIFIRKWIRGQRRFLGLNKRAEIEKISVINTFYYMYWIARLDSSSSVRYIVFDDKGQQVRKLQNMLNFDEKLRNELDSLTHFKKFISELHCFYCGSPLSKTDIVCPECAKEFVRCSVCKLPISQDDQYASCPKCKSKAHMSHLFEWVKTQGKCPTCLQEIKLRNLILSSDE